MPSLSLSAGDLKKMIKTAFLFLKDNQQAINDLNVYPVPDGDTGTNMYLTMKSVIEAIQEKDPQTLKELGEIMTHHSLLGARGNSGVILSQIIRGFCLSWKDLDELKPQDFIMCLEKANEIAYKAVSKPVEGTMLTVLRETTEELKKIRRFKDLDYETIFESALVAAERSLKNTPELLPILKESGVVDAGGYGILILLKGAYAGYLGKEISAAVEEFEKVGNLPLEEEVNYTYCTEVLVDSGSIDTKMSESYLQNLGDSVLVVSDGITTRAHVHTDKPADVLSYFMNFGQLLDVKINNMRIQAKERTERLKEEPQAVVSISVGEGFKEIFKSLGASVVLNGGQSFNPSTQQIIKAIEDAPSKNVILLPNNKNIVMTGEQAAKSSRKNVKLIPTRTIQQGIKAMFAYNPDLDFEENIRRMGSAFDDITSVAITKAIRSSTLNGVRIKEGDYIGLIENEVVTTGSDITTVYLETVKRALTNNHSFITIFFGSSVSDELKDQIYKVSQKELSEYELEFKDGGQSQYDLLISIE